MRMTLDTTGVVTLPELVRCYHPQVSLKEVRYAMEVFIPQVWRPVATVTHTARAALS